MAKITAPPIAHPVVDQTGVSTPQWVLFFNSIFTGDTGTEWTPTFQNLTQTGGDATITGKYYKISQNLVYFRIDIKPETSTSSVAGTTYCDNFPLMMRGDGFNVSVAPASGTGGAIGVCTASSGRIFTPPWTNINVPVIILGMVEAQ